MSCELRGSLYGASAAVVASAECYLLSGVTASAPAAALITLALLFSSGFFWLADRA